MRSAVEEEDDKAGKDAVEPFPSFFTLADPPMAAGEEEPVNQTQRNEDEGTGLELRARVQV